MISGCNEDIIFINGIWFLYIETAVTEIAVLKFIMETCVLTYRHTGITFFFIKLHLNVIFMINAPRQIYAHEYLYRDINKWDNCDEIYHMVNCTWNYEILRRDKRPSISYISDHPKHCATRLNVFWIVATNEWKVSLNWIPLSYIPLLYSNGSNGLMI